MRIKIKLLSDLCTCSGETYNSIVDMDVVYDENGIPYIPAKRIKGCIREAALEMCEMGLMDRNQYVRIFGEAGSKKSTFSLSNAYIADYKDTVYSLQHFGMKSALHRAVISPQNVLQQYTGIRTQTAVNMENGVADKNSLRTMRVVRKGLIFYAECDVKEEDSKLLGQAISLVKHMGVSRTRGLGLVSMSLENISSEINREQEYSHVLISEEQISEQNKIGYTIHLNSSLICKSAKGNQAETQDYIAGSKVLGLIAGALGKNGYEKLMEQSSELIVTNAYIMNQSMRCVPGRISLKKEKDQGYDEQGRIWLKDMLYSPNIEEKQMTSANIDYVDANHRKADVATEISYHHQRPSDKSIGRATGRDDGSSFYQLAGIRADQNFRGYIYANKIQAKEIISAVGTLGKIRMGYGRGSEFGDVELVLDSVSEVRTEKCLLRDAVVTLVSDMILYNENGVWTTDIDVLKNYLEEMTGVERLEIRNPFIRYTTIGGYNVTWKARKPIFNALGKGSTFILHSEEPFDAGLLSNHFVGERVSEGYGEIQVEETADTADVYVWKDTELSPSSDIERAEDGHGLINQLLQNEFEYRVQNVIREKLENIKNDYKSAGDAVNAAVSKLRIIFRRESTYEDMKKQVEGIEKDEKKKICSQLIGLVVPEQLAEQVNASICQDYGQTFKNQWDSQNMYKKMYYAYITELKYFAKSLEKGEA